MNRTLVISIISILIIIFIAPIMLSNILNSYNPTEEPEQYVSIKTPINFDYFKTAETIDVNSEINDDIFLIAKTVNINAKINGSLFVISETTNIKSEITDNVYAINKKLILTGSIDKNLRLIGEETEIKSFVNKNLGFICAKLNISGSGEVGQDLYGIGREISIEGRVGRDAIIQTDDDTNNSDAKVAVSGRIGRDLKYKNTRPNISSKAIIAGQTINLYNEQNNTNKSKKLEVLIAVLLTSLVSFLVGLTMISVNKKAVIFTVNAIKEEKLSTFLTGIYVFIILLIASFILFITIIGIPLAAIILMFIFLNFFIFLLIPFGIIIGNLIFPTKKDSSISLFTGVFILSILWLNPAISGILTFVMGIFTLGSVYKLIKRIKFTTNI